jgi:hypothetical protein
MKNLFFAEQRWIAWIQSSVCSNLNSDFDDLIRIERARSRAPTAGREARLLLHNKIMRTNCMLKIRGYSRGNILSWLRKLFLRRLGRVWIIDCVAYIFTYVKRALRQVKHKPTHRTYHDNMADDCRSSSSSSSETDSETIEDETKAIIASLSTDTVLHRLFRNHFHQLLTPYRRPRN